MAVNPSIANRPFQISAWGVKPQSQPLRALEGITFIDLAMIDSPNFVAMRTQPDVKSKAYFPLKDGEKLYFI